ncbi:MAG: phosphoribosylformylglycinamidine cyclo-ligase [Bacteroidetes bacterium]|nr:phosphoribosylformylglycinamidine cyclo-ligase [Bacteroidota bacterium]
MSRYAKRGVSAQKEDVHAAVQQLNPGLYPNSFCKVYPDFLCNDEKWVSIMHADGAGTKSILAYLYWRETGDLSVWRGVAEDAIVMNLDDLLCVGVTSSFLFSSTIDRNKKLIPGEVLTAIIDGTRSFFDQMSSHGVNIQFMGGETADVGDLVRTITINGTMTARWLKANLVTNEKIQPGNIIVGLAGFGQSSYESAYNSGIASNGLTSARHDLLNSTYRNNYPESWDPALETDVAYTGPYTLNSEIIEQDNRYTIGQLLLSPTRTFAPVLKEILEQIPEAVNGLIHCSGGGQTKCLKYLPGNFRVVKDNLFTPPVIFNLIQESSGSDLREMMQVFNMGTRLEVYTNPQHAQAIIDIAASYGVAAQIIGRVEEGIKKELHIHHENQLLVF